jgi:hypothetical protein
MSKRVLLVLVLALQFFVQRPAMAQNRGDLWINNNGSMAHKVWLWDCCGHRLGKYWTFAQGEASFICYACGNERVKVDGGTRVKICGHSHSRCISEVAKWENNEWHLDLKSLECTACCDHHDGCHHGHSGCHHGGCHQGHAGCHHGHAGCHHGDKCCN